MEYYTYWYASAAEKLGRAYYHAEQLAQRTARYLDSEPFTIVEEKRDGDTHYLLKMPFPVPAELTLVAGDAVQNARASLDHLVCALAELRDGMPAARQKRVAFPIMATAAEYRAACDDLAPKIGSKAAAAIDRLRPCKTGNRPLWLLHQLNLIDKHRMLVSVVTASHSTRLKLGSESSGQPTDISASWGPKDRDVIMSAPPARFNFGPAEHDSLLLRIEGEKSFEVDPTFALGLCLHEPGLTDYDPLVETIEGLVGAAGEVLGVLVEEMGPHSDSLK